MDFTSPGRTPVVLGGKLAVSPPGRRIAVFDESEGGMILKFPLTYLIIELTLLIKTRRTVPSHRSGPRWKDHTDLIESSKVELHSFDQPLQRTNDR